MSDLIWLADAQMRRIEPWFPLSHGVLGASIWPSAGVAIPSYSSDSGSGRDQVFAAALRVASALLFRTNR